MPIADDSFDVALCQLGLQFFPDRPAALREIGRVVVAGGRLAVNVPGPTPQVFAVMAEGLARHVDPGLAGFVNAVFSIDDAQTLRDMIGGAGFEDVSVTAYTKTLRFPEPAAFLWQYVRSTPLADAVAKAGEASRSGVERDVVAGWKPFTQDGTLVLEQGVLIATARSA